MKTITLLMAGFITCTTMLHAQDVGTDYQVIVLSQNEEVTSITDENLLYWKYGSPTTKATAPKDRVGKKKSVQVIVIEPSHTPKCATSGNLMLCEYMFGKTCPETAWYEWFNPLKFLPKWAEFWTKETDASPVVLAMIKF
jgi:hypothetical protein